MESDVADIPYLKAKTIRRFIDPFDAWYARWPEFDEASRYAFVRDGYRFLAISDIAAYFENIQLPILRDHLLKFFPGDHKIVNLLMHFLETWAIKTADGRSQLRGIPQGTQISSFLGNLFLIPLDEVFEDFSQTYDIKYFRYMDDVRIFAKDYTVARRAIMAMDRELRRLHLNTQSAKTVILDESNGRQISLALIDDRLDQLNEIIKRIPRAKTARDVSRVNKNLFLRRLNEIAHHKPSPPEQPILQSRQPLRGLSQRAFRRWITAHALLFSSKYCDRLFREIRLNPDYRLTRKIISTARQFSSHASLGNRILEFLESPYNIFKHQEAELLWAARYLDTIPKTLIERARQTLIDDKEYFYVRMQAAYLLARLTHNETFLNECMKLFRQEDSPHVQGALAGLLIQYRGHRHRSFLRAIVFHPNEQVRKIGRLFREVEFDEDVSKNKVVFALSPDVRWRIYDSISLLYGAAESDRPEILRHLLRRIGEHRKAHKTGQISETLAYLQNRATLKLRAVENQPQQRGRDIAVKPVREFRPRKAVAFGLGEIEAVRRSPSRSG